MNDNNQVTATLQNGVAHKLLYTVEEASYALSLSPGMIRKLARTGRLKMTRIGRSVRLSQATLLDLCSGQVLGGVK